MLTKLRQLVGKITLVVIAQLAVANDPKTLYTEEEVAQHDTLLMAGAQRFVYENGVSNQSFATPPLSGPMIALPSSGVRVKLNGWSEITLSRMFSDDQSDAYKESIFATDASGRSVALVAQPRPRAAWKIITKANGEKSVKVSYPTTAPVSMLDYVYANTSSRIKLPYEVIDELKKTNVTELESFDYICSLKRDEIVSKPWPTSAERLGLFETCVQTLVGNCASLNRVEVRNLIVFYSSKTFKDRFNMDSRIFSKVSGSWLCDMGIVLKSVTGTELENPTRIIAAMDIETQDKIVSK